MSIVVNLVSVADVLFSFFPSKSLKDWVNIIATSKSNPLKDSLLRHWNKSKNFQFAWDPFWTHQTFYYINFFKNVEFLTLNQYQRTLTPIKQPNSEGNDDIIAFLDAFHQKLPQISKQIKIIRLLTLFYASDCKAHYLSGTLPNIHNYSDFLSKNNDSNNNDAVTDKKYPKLEGFISVGRNFNNMILPKHIKYISEQSNNFSVIDIDNMDADASEFESENTAFKQLFAVHQNLVFFRVRAAYENKQVSAISPQDFETAPLGKLKYLSIENNVSFRWDTSFVNLLSEKLNPDHFLFLYLTFEGMTVFPVSMGRLREEFLSKFPKAFMQNRELREQWHLLMQYHKTRCKCCH